MKTIEQIETEIERLTKLRNDVKVRAESLTPSQRVAELLHEKRCRPCSEDQCGWCYESWAKPGSTRRRWEERARKSMEKMTEAEIANALDVLG